ncbi:MAG: phage protease XkdF family protein [Firmicutes bacterium]|nr:phage protease XkdF family protein [Bacillota bacterium]
MPTEIKNAQISFVSLVDKAANKKKFAIIKAAETPTFERSIPILKVDEEKRIVTGIVYEPDALDAHDEFMTAEEIEKSAHQFLKDYRNIDKQHDFVAGQAEVVESWIAKAEEKLGDQDIKKGTWLMSVHVPDDDTWGEIKKGELTGFSMGGVGERVEHDDIQKSEMEQATGLLQVLKNFFSVGTIQKGEVAETFASRAKSNNFWAAFSTLQDTLQKYNWSSDRYEFESDAGKVQEALSEFSTIITEILTTDNVVKAMGRPSDAVLKAGKKISTANMAEIKSAHEALSKLIDQNAVEESEEVKKEDIEKMMADGIAKALEPVTAKLSSLEKGAEPVTEPDKKAEQPEMTAEDVTKMVTEAVAKAVEPLTQRVEKVEAARGIVKQLETETAPVASVAKSYMEHFK